MHHKRLTMHEPARCSGGRRGDREVSMRDETVFDVRILGTTQISVEAALARLISGELSYR